MVVDSLLPHVESGLNDHREDAPHFMIGKIYLVMKYFSGGFLGCSMFPHLLVNWSLLSGHWFIESFEKTDFKVRRKNYEDFYFSRTLFLFCKKDIFYQFENLKILRK